LSDFLEDRIKKADKRAQEAGLAAKGPMDRKVRPKSFKIPIVSVLIILIVMLIITSYVLIARHDPNILITSLPVEAEVYVNEVLEGSTGEDGIDLYLEPSSFHDIEVRKQGYQSFFASVSVDEYAKQHINANLENTMSLPMDSEGSSAEISDTEFAAPYPQPQKEKKQLGTGGALSGIRGGIARFDMDGNGLVSLDEFFEMHSRKDSNQDGVIDDIDMPKMAESGFVEQFDQDQDWSVSQEEFKEFFSQADADEDNHLSMNEISDIHPDYLELKATQMIEHDLCPGCPFLHKYDADGDGKASLDEFSERFLKKDLDGDGVVDEADNQPGMIKEYDGNKDGKVLFDEYLRYFDGFDHDFNGILEGVEIPIQNVGGDPEVAAETGMNKDGSGGNKENMGSKGNKNK